MPATRETPAAADPAVRRPIVFFDGECGMCNRFVDRILRADRKGTFLFAPLQGETARRMLPPLPADPGEWSVIYLDERGIHDRSDATLEVYRRLGGGWSVLALARFVPRSVRTRVYRWIGRNRYRWYRRGEACRATAADRGERFLP